MRRSLVAMSLITQKSPIRGLDGKPLMTEPSVRDAVKRVAADLDKLRQGRGYTAGAGWAIEQPPEGENGVHFAVVETEDDYAVVGQMIVRRDQ